MKEDTNRKVIVEKNGNNLCSYSNELKGLFKVIYEHSGKIIIITTFLISCLTAYLKLCQYFYEWGYISMLKIDKSFIDIGNTSLYEMVGALGVLMVVFFLNYIVYGAINQKKYAGVFILLLLEFVFVLVGFYEFTNTNFGEEITYVIRIGKLPDLILSWIIIFLLVVELNFWGMYSAFERHRILRKERYKKYYKKKKMCKREIIVLM